MLCTKECVFWIYVIYCEKRETRQKLAPDNNLFRFIAKRESFFFLDSTRQKFDVWIGVALMSDNTTRLVERAENTAERNMKNLATFSRDSLFQFSFVRLSNGHRWLYLRD